MRRLLLCMPLCLLMAPNGPRNAAPSAVSALADVADDGAALPTDARMKQLAESDPVAFLEACLRRYDREAKGYHCILHKQERLEGTLQPSEEIACDFREEPFSVRMDWQKGAGLAQRTLFIKGENKDKILVKGTGLLALAGVVERDTDGPDAKKSSRYPINEFGIKMRHGALLACWKQAVKDKVLHVEFLGEAQVKEVGDRVCWKVRAHRLQGAGRHRRRHRGDLLFRQGNLAASRLHAQGRRRKTARRILLQGRRTQPGLQGGHVHAGIASEMKNEEREQGMRNGRQTNRHSSFPVPRSSFFISEASAIASVPCPRPPTSPSATYHCFSLLSPTCRSLRSAHRPSRFPERGG